MDTQAIDIGVGEMMVHCIMIGVVPFMLFKQLMALLKALLGASAPSEATVRRRMASLLPAGQPSETRGPGRGTRPVLATPEQLKHLKERGLVPHQTGNAALISVLDAAVILQGYDAPAQLVQQLQQARPALQMPMQPAPLVSPAVSAPTGMVPAATGQHPLTSLPFHTPPAMHAAPNGMALLSALHPNMVASSSSQQLVQQPNPPTPSAQQVCSPAAAAAAASTAAAAAAAGSSSQALAARPLVNPAHDRAMVLNVVQRGLPSSSSFSRQQLARRSYILQRGCPARTHLEQQMRPLEKFFTDEVDLARPDEVRRLAPTTWETICLNILRYGGFLNKHATPPVAWPVLQHTLNMGLVQQFVCFLRARGCSRVTLAEQVDVAMKVVTWLVTCGQLPAGTSVEAAQWHLVLLKRLRDQLRTNLPPKPRKPLPVLVTPEHLTVLVVSLVENATLLVQNGALDTTTSGQARVELAEQIMLACMASLFWAYAPPLRSSGVRSITGPWYQGPCPHPSCGDPDNCPGNKISYIDGPGSALHLVLTHLKTSRWASFVPVSFTLPPELTKLFTAFIEVARGIIMTARWPDHPYMFVNTQTFNQLRPQEISQWFRMAFPEEIQHLIPSPRACRTMFVGMMRRLTRPVAAPFTEQQAALVMSNRQATWDAAYDRERVSRQQQAAIDGMGLVRQQLIGYHQLEPVAGAAAAVDTSVGDGDQSITDYGSSSSSDDDQPARRAAAQQGSAELPRLMQQWLSTAPVGQQDASVAEMHVSQPAAAEVAHQVAQAPAATAAAAAAPTAPAAGRQAAQAPPAAATAAHQVAPAAAAAAAPAAGWQAAHVPAAAAAAPAPGMLPAYPGAIPISNSRDRMLQHSANLLSAVGRALERRERRVARLRQQQQQQQEATRKMAAGRVATTGGFLARRRQHVQQQAQLRHSSSSAAPVRPLTRSTSMPGYLAQQQQPPPAAAATTPAAAAAAATQQMEPGLMVVGAAPAAVAVDAALAPIAAGEPATDAVDIGPAAADDAQAPAAAVEAVPAAAAMEAEQGLDAAAAVVAAAAAAHGQFELEAAQGMVVAGAADNAAPDDEPGADAPALQEQELAAEMPAQPEDAMSISSSEAASGSDSDDGLLSEASDTASEAQSSSVNDSDFVVDLVSEEGSSSSSSSATDGNDVVMLASSDLD